MLFLFGIRPNFVVTAVIGAAMLAVGLILSQPVLAVMGCAIIVVAVIKAVAASHNRTGR